MHILNIYFNLLLIAHFLGDFYFQPDKLVKAKDSNLLFLLLHSTIYSLTITLVILINAGWMTFAYFGCILIFHFLIDYFKIHLTKNKNHKRKLFIYIFDQLLHVFCIVGIYWITSYNDFDLLIRISKWFNKLILPGILNGYTLNSIIEIILIILILLKPTSIIIDKVFKCLKSENFNIKWIVNGNYFYSDTRIGEKPIFNYDISKYKEPNQNELLGWAKSIESIDYTIEKELPKAYCDISYYAVFSNTINDTYAHTESSKNNGFDEIDSGVIIGILERLLILLFAIINLWSSIALILTAKSIARFKQMENKEFAIKYLVGTLLSLFISLVCIWIFLTER
jgi:hypothetical protein